METDPKPDVTLNECGGMRLMSVEEPEPGEVGFTSVVSMSVQPSPLKPQPPGCWGRRRMRGRKVISLIAGVLRFDVGGNVPVCK